MSQLIAYQSYPSEEEATVVARQLRENGIRAEVTKLKTRIDAVFTGITYSADYQLSIAGEDFTRANKLLYSADEFDISIIDSEHPLYSLTEQELRDIIARPDEWGPDNYKIALALLQQKGIDVSEPVLQELQQQRTAVIATQQSMNGYLLFIGYALPVISFIRNAIQYDNQRISVVWYFPGVLGMLIGLVVLKAKTTLPDGTRIGTYDSRSLKHGLYIFIFNVIAWLVNFFTFIYFTMIFA